MEKGQLTSNITCSGITDHFDVQKGRDHNVIATANTNIEVFDRKTGKKVSKIQSKNHFFSSVNFCGEKIIVTTGGIIYFVFDFILVFFFFYFLILFLFSKIKIKKNKKKNRR